MFGVRIIVFACTLFGVAVSLPLDLAEAKPHHSSRGSYSQYLRKSYAKQHARKSYAKHHTRKSHVQQSSRKTTAKLHVKASASASVGATTTWRDMPSRGMGPAPCLRCQTSR